VVIIFVTVVEFYVQLVRNLTYWLCRELICCESSSGVICDTSILRSGWPISSLPLYTLYTQISTLETATQWDKEQDNTAHCHPRHYDQRW